MSYETKRHMEEEVEAYEEGLLTDDENMEVELHMRGCNECRATFKGVTGCLPEMNRAMGPRVQWKNVQMDAYEEIACTMERR